MRFEEQLRAPVSAAEVWDLLWDVPRVAACLPGCVGVEEVEPRKSYRARFEDHIGPYKVSFELNVVVEDARPGERIRLLATGQDRRLGVSQRVALDVALRDSAPCETVLDVQADIEILGKAATLGQFAIKRKAQAVVRHFAQNMEAALLGVRDRGLREGDTPDPQPLTPSPLQGGGAPS